MTIVYERFKIQVHEGDCLDVLRAMPAASVHAVITDPPYGLSELPTKKIVAALTKWLGGDREYVPVGRGFMGRQWDKFVPPPAVWDECFRVLRPGGHLLSFAGSRTADLMGISIRLAGFEFRDTIDCRLSSLKPAHEPIIVARKPAGQPVAASVLEHGTGALNIAACRVGDDTSRGDRYNGMAPRGSNGSVDISGPRNSVWEVQPGRWPPNVVLSHSALQGVLSLDEAVS